MPWLLLIRSPWTWVALAFVGISGYAFVVRVERDYARNQVASVQAAFDAFKAKVAAEGEKAKLRNAEIAAQSEEAKNEAVQTLQNRLEAVARDLDRVRRQRDDARGSLLPPVPAGPAKPNVRASFDRTVLDGALRSLDRGVEGLVTEGDRGITQRDAWHLWYLGQVKAEGGKVTP
jgi:hypothetical protein